MMFKKDMGNRSCVTLSADYEPQLDFQARLPKAGEACLKNLELKNTWSIGVVALLRDVKRRALLIIGHQRVSLQFLGTSSLQSDLDRYSTVARLALREMGVQKIQRLGIKIQLFLSLSMTHEELVDLLRGAFLAPTESLEVLCGKIDDAIVQLHGTRSGMKLTLMIVPVNAEHAANWFMAFPNLEHFLEPKLLDMTVKEFKERIEEDGLLLDIELFRLNADPGDIPFFIPDALNECEAIADEVLRMLKALPHTGVRQYASTN